MKEYKKGSNERRTVWKDDAVCLRAARQAGISDAVWSHGHWWSRFPASTFPPLRCGFHKLRQWWGDWVFYSTGKIMSITTWLNIISVVVKLISRLGRKKFFIRIEKNRKKMIFALRFCIWRDYVEIAAENLNMSKQLCFFSPLDIWRPIALMSLDVTQLRSAVRAAAASVAQRALRDSAMEACLSDLEFLSVLQPTKQRHLLPKWHKINATAPCL